jgi:hypothetical protein
MFERTLNMIENSFKSKGLKEADKKLAEFGMDIILLSKFLMFMHSDKIKVLYKKKYIGVFDILFKSGTRMHRSPFIKLKEIIERHYPVVIFWDNSDDKDFKFEIYIREYVDEMFVRNEI